MSGDLRRIDRARWLRGAAVLAVTLAYFGHVFQITSGEFLRSGLSGWLDPYFINYLLEHWYYCLLHGANPASPSMFYPAPGALGYSCGLILYVPFYVVVRPFMHPFTACTVSLFLMMETGALCLYALLRRFVRVGFIESLLLTVFFISSVNVINSWHTNVWSQTASIFLVPPILMLTLVTARRPAGWAGALLAGLCGLLWMLLFTQDFYTGWLLALLAGLLAVGALVIVRKQPILAWLVAAWHTRRPALLAFAAGAGAGALVFFWIYLGAHRERPGFPEEQLLAALIRRGLPDWSHPIAAAQGLVVYAGTRSFALVAVVGLLAWMPWFKMPLRVRFATLWFLVVSAIVALVAVKFSRYTGSRSYSLWKQLFHWVPGHSAIRDPKRIIYSYELAVSILTGVFLARLPRRSILRIVTALAVFALLLAQPNREIFHFARPTQMFDRWVRAPIAVTGACESFFVIRASDDYVARSVSNSTYGIDAAFIALSLSIPTLNGYSAWEPPNWSLSNPAHPAYADAVRDWVIRQRLHGVCRLDLDARTMTPYDPALPDRAAVY